MIDLNNFQSINLSQFFDSVKFRSGSGDDLLIDFSIVMFYMLIILIKFSFVPQNFFRILERSSLHEGRAGKPIPQKVKRYRYHGQRNVTMASVMLPCCLARSYVVGMLG